MVPSRSFESKVQGAISKLFNYKQPPDPITSSRSSSCDSAQQFLDPPCGPAQAEGPLKQFALFPNLPIELRLLIWRCALRRPCLIELYDRTWDEYSPAIAPNSTTPLLPLLRACRESHQVISDRYRKIYASGLALTGMPPGSAFWFDDARDALFFHTRSCSTTQILALATPECLGGVRRVVLMLEPLVMRAPQLVNPGSARSAFFLPNLLTRFGALEEVVMAARLPGTRFLPAPDRVLRVDHGGNWREMGVTYGVRGFEARMLGLLRLLMAAPWKGESGGGGGGGGGGRPIEITFSEFYSGEWERERWKRWSRMF